MKMGWKRDENGMKMRWKWGGNGWKISVVQEFNIATIGAQSVLHQLYSIIQVRRRA